MACNCDIDLVIASCPPFANLDSVRDAIERLQNTCCVGVLTDPCINPVDNPVESVAEAFPDGIASCSCDEVWIIDAQGNVYASWDTGQTFTIISTVCVGRLTTPGLDPCTDYQAAMEEAFGACPLGSIEDSCPPCEIIYMILQDGSIAISTDGCQNWVCDTQSPIVPRWGFNRTFSTNAGGVPPNQLLCNNTAGTNSPNNCTQIGGSLIDYSCTGYPPNNTGEVGLFIFPDAGPLAPGLNQVWQQGEVIGPSTNPDVNYRRSVWQQLVGGVYHLSIWIDYTGQFHNGAGGCPIAATTDGKIELMRLTPGGEPQFVRSFAMGGYSAQNAKAATQHVFETVVPLVEGEEYYIRVCSRKFPTGCPVPVGGIDHRGSANVRGVFQQISPDTAVQLVPGVVPGGTPAGACTTVPNDFPTYGFGGPGYQISYTPPATPPSPEFTQLHWTFHGRIEGSFHGMAWRQIQQPIAGVQDLIICVLIPGQVPPYNIEVAFFWT